MNLEYLIDPDDCLVRMTISGKVTFPEWNSGMDAILADPRFQPGFDFLVNLAEIADPPDTAFIRRLTGYFSSHQEQLGRSRRAVLVTSPGLYGMVRMEELLAEATGVAVRPFYRFEDAVRWLQSGDD